ncbi:MFS transporter [Candidiatus Paracoxiella cheracis]|uniref:MFS transporter n=1 Tax=Candidiatus Paracoxiella cheracis TaxID=3405120 RepID=UPI003BF5B4E0
MKLPLLMESKARIWIVLSGICLAIFAVAFNTTAVMNALVALSNELHLSPTSLQWIVNAYLLACASFIVVGGQLGDMYGRRKIFLMGALGFIFSSLLIALSHTPTLIIIGRALQGLSAAIITPGTLAIIKVAFSGEKERYAVGAWTASIGLGFAFGPVISGLFTTYISWRDIFWTNIPIMCVAIAIIYLFARKSRGPKENTKLDLWGLVLLLSGLLPFTLGLVEGNVWGWSSLTTLILLVGGGILLILFWIVEHAIKSPLVDFYHFREKLFIAGNVGIAASIFTLLGILYFFNTFIQNPILFNYSPIEAGIAILPLSMAMFVMSLVTGSITKHIGYRIPMVIALLIIAVATYLLHNINVHSTYSDMWLPLLLFGIGVGVSMPCSPSLGMSALPIEKAGEGSGIINTVNYYSGVLCVAIGTLFSIYGGRNALQGSLTTHKLSPSLIDKIDKVIVGHQGSLQALIAEAGSTTKTTIIHTAQKAIVHSFSTVMLMCMVVALLGAVAIFFIVTKKKVSS